MDKNKKVVFELMRMFWSTKNDQLQEDIVKVIYKLMKEDLDNEL